MDQEIAREQRNLLQIARDYGEFVWVFLQRYEPDGAEEVGNEDQVFEDADRGDVDLNIEKGETH